MKPGTLLISPPLLGDPHFDRSVVLLCRHSPAEGAFGLVLTRPGSQHLADALALTGGKQHRAAGLVLGEGGPVQLNTLHFVHRRASLPGAVPLGQDVYWGGDFDLLLELVHSGDVPLADVRCFVGYSGWSPGQLEGEIERGSWIRQPASAGKVFTLRPEAFWQSILREKGGRFRALSNYPADPRLN